MGTTGALPRLKIEQVYNTSTDRRSLAGESSTVLNSDRMHITDFVSENNDEGKDTDSELIGDHSERLTTPRKSQKSDQKSHDYRERLRHASQPERNMMFHDAMLPFSSILIQPSGQALLRSCKLDQPVFTLREKPVRQQYKQAVAKINHLLHPELAEHKPKVEQSISNMMVSNKGSPLEQQKQMTQLGLNTIWCKGIKSSASTLNEHLEIDKEKMESEEERAIFRMICMIK